MQRDLMRWDQALRLAKTLAEDEVPLICKEYGVQLEFDGDFPGALNMFERAQEEGSELDEESRNVCEQGTARNLIRTGDVRAGVAMAESIGQKSLFVECGRILEDIKQLNEAATFYEKAQMYEKAASIYIQSKNFTAAKPIMDFIRSTKLHVLYAKAKEAEGNFRAAVQSYEVANDLVSVVNLSLNKLNEPEKAFEIARKSRSPEAAALVAKFCQKTGDHRGAIEFSILSRRGDLAFNVAKTTNEMAFFADQIGDHGSQKQYRDIASYYESKDDFPQAAIFHERCGETEWALELYLRGGEKYLDQAIDLVGRARSEELIHTLASFVLGESDGIVKDMKYVFKLYIVLENYERAAQTAVMIAEQELEFGNYANARRVLFDTYQELRSHHVSIPQKLRRTLLLLHSYVIVKPLMKSGDHESAARMLLRVAKNISKFQQHIVPILTLTVVESHRAGLKETATEYAAMLCRPEYRESIAEQYRRKIEGLVRRRKKEEDVEESTSPCVFCGRDVPLTRLDCPHCLSIIPYCIVTGRHMVKADFSFCPQCRFPALFSEFSKHVAKTKTCPMCEKAVSISDIEKVGDVVAWIKKESHHESGETADSEKPTEEDGSVD
jgi:WD repeat-containing protein 19